MDTNEGIRAKDILPHKTSFSAGDGFYGDGNTSFFMEADALLKLTAQNALAGNLAPAFDPTRTEDNKYLAGESVVYEGKIYTFKVDHYGAWDASHVYREDESERIAEIASSVNFVNKDNYTKKLYGKFARSGVSASGVLDINQLFRVASVDIISFAKNVILNIEDGFRCVIYYFSAGVYQYSSGWVTGKQLIPANMEFRILIGRVTENMSEVADIAEFSSKVTFLDSIKFVDDKLNLLSEESNVYPIVNTNWEVGGLNNGNETSYQNRARFDDILPVKAGDKICFDFMDSFFSYAVSLYDNLGSFTSSTDWISNDNVYDVATGVCFVRVAAKKNDNTNFNADEISILKNLITIVVSGAVETDAEARLRQIASNAGCNDKTLLWEQGSIDQYGRDIASTARARTVGFVPVKKNDMLVIKTENRKFAVNINLYGSNKVFLGRSTGEYISSDRNYIIGDDVAFVRLNARLIDGSATFTSELISELASLVVTKEIETNRNKFFRKKVHNVGSYPPVYQDGTFINDKLWMFRDSADSPVVYVYDVTTNTYTTKSQHLGHCNSVDYNEENDSLMVYFTGNNQPGIYIYKNPSVAADLDPSDSSCTTINLFKTGDRMNPTGGVCWGEDRRTAYYMDGVYSNSEKTEKTKVIKVYKLLLGMGSDDRSAVARGFGTFVSGKSANEYNGTASVEKEYIGTIVDGIDIVLHNNDLGTIQGMQFDGDLYCGWGWLGQNFIRIRLNENGTYDVLENYGLRFFAYESGQEIWLEPELVALTDTNIFCGVQGDTKRLVRLSR